MVIKGYKQVKELVNIGIIGMIVLFIAEWIEFKSFILAFLNAVFLAIVIFRTWVALGRTIVLNHEGIEVSFLNYRKKYLWEDLQTKQLIDYRNAYGSCYPYEKGVLFSKKYLLRPRWLSLDSYADTFHPWHAIYINFYSGKDLGNVSSNRYLVDEKEFMAKMQEWGIELEEKDSIFSNPK